MSTLTDERHRPTGQGRHSVASAPWRPNACGFAYRGARAKPREGIVKRRITNSQESAAGHPGWAPRNVRRLLAMWLGGIGLGLGLIAYGVYALGTVPNERNWAAFLIRDAALR